MCCRPSLAPPELSLQRISSLTTEQQRLRAQQNKRAFALLKAIAATQTSASTGNIADYPALAKLLAERAAKK
jgi:hypothetical protein